MDDMKIGSLGWSRDLPDFRDFTSQTPEIESLLGQSALLKAAVASAPVIMDLRQWCSPIEQQGKVGSCTANAGVGLIEYFQRRAFNKYEDASRLFLYKVTRNLLNLHGDTGASLRETMKAMVLFGVPPEKYWPYDETKLDEEPPAFCYAYAQNYKSLRYYRLDPPGLSLSEVLSAIKRSLAGQLPCMFGFSVYSSIPKIGEGRSDIPFPQQGDGLIGGHAVVAVGYDDNRKIGVDIGAVQIRNSWGTAWGDQGFGWLPYSYILKGLATDFWSLIQANFVDTTLFK